MVFSSLPFQFFFLPLFFLVYFAAKKRKTRNMVLLGFSMFFYAWGEPIYVLLMMFSIANNYVFGYFIAKNSENKKRAKYLLIASVAVNLFVLGLFKYTDFIIGNLRLIPGLSWMEPLGLALPIGISFYTFQTMSYTIEVYKKETNMQKNIATFGAYVAGFPQLIAGPIVRYRDIAEELDERIETTDEFAEGLRRFTAGLAKKILIANTMAEACDNIMAKYSGGFADSIGALGMWLAILAYTLQIYYDFSGYSDMAIGLGRMMGFHYLENFNYPYISKSVTEFWRRWHMSLSSVFRDFVYIPLGGNRVKTPRWIFNMLVVWFLTGLWHGAQWTFILWGAYFGALLIFEKLVLKDVLQKFPVIGHIYTITAFVFGWIIFRAESLPHIGTILSAMFGASGAGSALGLAENGMLKPMYLVVMAVGIICSVPVSKKIKAILEKNKKTAYIIDAASVVAVILCIMMLAQGAYNPFIYFRF
ncbi:MAG: MBOAT family protein [Oscillospiraceae bacterium]|nr:MBOAT family protein [Oscillospiraceae bacterium]